MIKASEAPTQVRPRMISLALLFLSKKWEVLYFMLALALLYLQVFLFVFDADSLPSLRGWFAAYALYQNFSTSRLHYVITPVFVALFSFLLLCRELPKWTRRCLDILGLFIVIRMLTQLVGLNILVFDFVTPRFLLIEQLLFFLPYLLLVWGWIYWRLDMIGRRCRRPLFRFDYEGETPRPVDYFIASFSSVLSPTVFAFKGNCARARILVIVHGLMIYDVMGLTFSRAVALVQGR